ncbi:MAG: hypothetical protein HFG49_13945 [Lachnospiraceae bacterium]|jgi:hypothetical protein|nr:hypothetical protein [Lachnospiraceae bacterium]
MDRRKQRISLSDKMSKLIYLDRFLFAGAGCLVVGISCLISFLFLYGLAEDRFNKRQMNPAYFDSYTASGYSSTEIQYLTDYFAEHTKEGYRLYMGFDSTLKPFILCSEGDLPAELQALLDYTYGQEDDPLPEAVRISGFCRPLNSEIMGFARDSYSMMWDESEQIPISSDELSDMVGNYYLDIRSFSFQEEYPWSKAVFGFPVLFLFAGVLYLIRYLKRLKACRKRMEGWLEWLPAADREFADAKEFKKGLKIYLTGHYLILAVYYFDMIPLADIEELSENLNILMAVAKDGSNHMIIERHRCRGCYDQLKAELYKKIQEIKDIQQFSQADYNF